MKGSSANSADEVAAPAGLDRVAAADTATCPVTESWWSSVVDESSPAAHPAKGSVTSIIAISSRTFPHIRKSPESVPKLCLCPVSINPLPIKKSNIWNKLFHCL